MKNNLGIYIHIPFCVRKCNYCDFLSFPADDDAKRAYARALVREIRAYGETVADREVETVFIGGGTPSVMPADCLADIMKAVTSTFDVRPDAEITMEMNPGTGGEGLLNFLFSYVNRVSIGLQSADDAELQELGRIHTWQDFLSAYRMLRDAGMKNINVDLISAIPNQTGESWLRTLNCAADLKPEHISAYSLIVEEGTPFGKRKAEGSLKLPDEDLERRMYADTEETLALRGYHRYEISNYSLPGCECRHNVRYWTGGDYLGLGLGSSSLMNHVRWKNTSDPDEYLRSSANPQELLRDMESLSLKSQIEEFMFLGLRMTEGVTETEFRKRFDMDMNSLYGDVLEKLEYEEMITDEGGRVKLTGRGVDVSNRVLAEFLLD
ncbi:MAG: radical SAM family heme chaperone HemW [Lachnospiraceae bacterium]|jgi:oxygen-independent coproporphyrinogen-3 oxidase|nr:radical SAM family heme chaperone HemW [Lachnospiraceae bacterium]MCI1726435.1 radical SAM family heme chaperone HemW [Lachnospiraceae bacterium]